MIIGIGGDKQSGKNTVAKILQYFTLPKDLRSISVDEWVHELSYHPAVSDNISTYLEIKKYGDRLNECVSLIMGLPLNQLESSGLNYKKKLLPACWNVWVLEAPEYDMDNSIHMTKSEALIVANYLKLPRGAYTIEKTSLTVADYLQLMRDAGRDMIHPNIWVNTLFEDYTPASVTNIANVSSTTKGIKNITKIPSWPSWVIPDVRCLNEADAIKNGIPGHPPAENDFRFLIKVERDVKQGPDDSPAPEFELDDYPDWDYVIENNDNLDYLTFEVHRMLKSKKEFENYFHI